MTIIFFETATSILVNSNDNSFRVLFDKIASVCFTWKIYWYFSIGNGQPNEPALCQLHRHSVVPCYMFYGPQPCFMLQSARVHYICTHWWIEMPLVWCLSVPVLNCVIFSKANVIGYLELVSSRLLIVQWECFLEDTHTHTHPFNGPLSATTRVSRYQKGKTDLDYTEAKDSEWQWHQLGHMPVCISLQTDNHASTPQLNFLLAGCPSCRPTNSVKVLKAVF